MPGKKHLRGVGSKEQPMYEHIVKSAEKLGRYWKRSKEVAARTVLKHHQKATKRATEAEVRYGGRNLGPALPNRIE
jgi:hypothetical protein